MADLGVTEITLIGGEAYLRDVIEELVEGVVAAGSESGDDAATGA